MSTSIRPALTPSLFEPIDPRRRYNIPHALELLDISRKRLYDKVKAGEISIIKDGRRSYVPGSEIVRLSQVPQL